MEATTKTRAGYRPPRPGMCTRCRTEEATEQEALCAGCWEFLKDYFAGRFPKMAQHDLEKLVMSFFKREK